MAITCLDNFIGLRGACDDVAPVSGLFINDLAGINLKTMASLTNDEQESYVSVFDEIYRRSVADLEHSVTVKMQRFFKTNILLDNENFGYYKSPPIAESSSSNLVGTAINVKESKNTEIFINHVEVYLDAPAPTFEVFIYDYNTGNLLDTIAHDHTGQFNTIQVNKAIPILGQRKRIFVCYDGSLAGTTETSAFGSDDLSGVGSAKGATVPIGSAVIKSNLQFGGGTHGMVVNFNVECSVSNFICSKRNLLKTALWYKLGENVMIERANSDRLNYYTLVNQEEAKELQIMYGEKYNENLLAILDNLEMEGDNLCFPCEKKRSYKPLLP